MSDYYCINCGADLEDQFGFSPYADYWTCTECGQLLINPEEDDINAEYAGVGWFCDVCGAYLNKQSGFSDWYGTWTCTECGYTNNISEDEIYDSEEDYQANRTSRSNMVYSILKLINTGIHIYANAIGVNVNDDEDEDEDEDGKDDSGDEIDTYYSVSEYAQKIQEIRHRTEYEAQLKEERKKERRKRIWRTITRKKLRAGISSEQCRKMKYDDVIRALKASEFYKINTIILEDLQLDSISREGMVESVFINNKNTFDEESTFPFNARIEIVYHMLQKVSPPLTAREAKKKNIQEVVEKFSNAGFVNIEQVKILDLTTGWLIKDGSVDTITIDGLDSFKNKKFRLDARIKIRYHTFRKNRT